MEAAPRHARRPPKHGDPARARAPEPQPAGGPLRRDRTDYPLRVTQMLKDLYRKYVEARLAGEKWANFLKFYQYLVKIFVSDPAFGIGSTGNARGLLLWFVMGTGKTYAGIAIMLALWDERDVVVVLPRSLRGDHASSLRRVIALLHSGLPPDELERKQVEAAKRVKYASSDAYNLADQIARVGVAGEADTVEGSASLDGKLVIVDEAHGFSRAIINSPSETANARRLYDMIMGARNLRLVLMTGTPMAKDPFELVPLMNMLAGTDILPLQYEVFYRLYVDKEARRVKNRAKLANRLMGLVSHISHALPTAPPDNATEAGRSAAARPRQAGGFPEELPTVVERVEMDADQYRRYLLVREKEDAEGKGGEGGPRGAQLNTPALALPGSEKKAARSYYVKSRSLSNYAPPRDARGGVDSLPDSAFTASSSPKAALIVKRLEASPGSALVYSQFLEMGGLKVVARFLRIAEYQQFAARATARATAAPEEDGGIAPPDPDTAQSAGGAPAPSSASSASSILDEAAPSSPDGAAPSSPDGAAPSDPDAAPSNPGAAPSDPDAALSSILDEARGAEDDVGGIAESAEPVPSSPPIPPPAITADDIPPPAKRYAIISGEVPLKERLRILAVFNSPSNLRGAVIRALLVTKTGAEGLDLKNVRQTHTLESYWDMARLHQVVARAARMGSHDALPEKDRDVQPFLYLGVANAKVRADTPAKNREAKSIDEIFYERALERYELITDFRRLLRSVSLECSLFGYGKDCRVCVPTSEPLFHDNPDRDIGLADPCEPLAEREIEAKPVTVTGKDGAPATYYYDVDPSSPLGYSFFEPSESLGGYVTVDPGDPVIPALLRAIGVGVDL